MYFKIKQLLYPIASILFMLNISCKKNDTGGKAELHALIYKGNKALIGNNIVYVKFNAKSSTSNPTENYNLKVNGETDDNHVHIEDLRPGDYYLYAVSFDSSSMKYLSGGIAATIKWTERKKLKEVVIQVGE